MFEAAAAMVVPTVEGGSGGAWRQWVVDRETRNNFWGSPENFFGGGDRRLVAGSGGGRREGWLAGSWERGPSPLRGGFCWLCTSRAKTSFANDPNPNSFDESQNFSDYYPQPRYEIYPCELWRNDSHYGYDCPPGFPFCQSMNQNYFEPNPFYDSKSSCFDQFQPQQYSYVHQPSKEISIDELKIMMQSYCERMNQQREQEALLAAQREQELHEQKQAAQEKEEPPQNSDFRQLIGEICGIKVCEEQKQKLEDTMLVSSRLLSIMKNFRVIHKTSSISNTSQISLVIAIAPFLPNEELDNSLSIGDEHLSTIMETESDEVIKSSVENLIPIPSKFEGILDHMCDVPFSDKNHFDFEYDLIESLLTRDTSNVYSPKIDSFLEEFAGELAHIDPILSGIDETDSDPKDDIHFIEELLYDDTSKVKDEILRAKLFNIHYLIDKIDSLNNNPTPDCVLKSPSSSFLSYSNISLLEFETFSDHTEETSSGSTTTHADNSPSEYDLFLFEIEPDQGEFSSDSDFFSSDDSFGSGLEVSLTSGTRNKIFDPGIFIEVQSGRLLSREEFSISFIRDPIYPVFKHGSPQDLEASRARGFVHHPLELQSLANGNSIS
nr:hypothetical protein [Tanacetum cinerariifolium]